MSEKLDKNKHTQLNRESDFRAKEPLHSLLMESPVDALKFLHNNLHDYKSEAELNDYFAEVGLERRDFIQQLQYVMGLRKLRF